ncbi:MAG TPA: hypothetical protein VF796_11245 [Humisphaera sp.]
MLRRLTGPVCVLCLLLSLSAVALWFRSGATMDVAWLPPESAPYRVRMTSAVQVFTFSLHWGDVREPARWESAAIGERAPLLRATYRNRAWALGVGGTADEFVADDGRREGHRLWQAPYWLIAVATAIPPLAWALGRARRRARSRAWRRDGFCPACGFDRRGVEGPCPECGEA